MEAAFNCILSAKSLESTPVRLESRLHRSPRAMSHEKPQKHVAGDCRLSPEVHALQLCTVIT
jgi:hypothetical protein